MVVGGYSRARDDCDHRNTPAHGVAGAPGDLDAVCPDCGATVGVHQVESFDAYCTRAAWADARGDSDEVDLLMARALELTGW